MVERIKKVVELYGKLDAIDENYIDNIQIGSVDIGRISTRPWDMNMIIPDEVIRYMAKRKYVSSLMMTNKYDGVEIFMYDFKYTVEHTYKCRIDSSHYIIYKDRYEEIVYTDDLLQESEDLRNKALDIFNGASGWFPDAPLKWNINDPKRINSVLGVERPLIEEDYYVVGGVIMTDKEDLMFALYTRHITCDGGCRNDLIRQYQLAKEKDESEVKLTWTDNNGEDSIILSLPITEDDLLQ